MKNLGLWFPGLRIFFGKICKALRLFPPPYLLNVRSRIDTNTKRMITKSKNGYLRNVFQKNNTASKDIWTKINEIIHNRTKRTEDIVIS